MRIIRDSDGELIKGVKTPFSYRHKDVDTEFNYYLFVWLVDWAKATPYDRYDRRYYISIRAVSLDLITEQKREELILSRSDTLTPADPWGMAYDLLTEGQSAYLWDEDSDDRAYILRGASWELTSIPTTKWAGYNHCDSDKTAIDQMRGE